MRYTNKRPAVISSGYRPICFELPEFLAILIVQYLENSFCVMQIHVTNDKIGIFTSECAHLRATSRTSTITFHQHVQRSNKMRTMSKYSFTNAQFTDPGLNTCDKKANASAMIAAYIFASSCLDTAQTKALFFD